MLRMAFYIAAVALALLHVFVTFRGISSEEGMKQAQLARQMARTSSFQTKVIQPYAWAQMEAAGKKPSPLAMPETTQPPVQPLMWSVAFRLLQPMENYAPQEGGSQIYFFDRVIACFGVIAWLLTIYLTHGAARRLFDEQVAAITAIALLVCMPGWELASSGSPRTWLLPLFALAFRLYASASARAAEGQGIGLRMLLLGIVCGALVLTHWMAWWLVLGIIVGVLVFLPGGRAGAVIVAAFPFMALSALAWWNTQLCSDPLGGAKALLQAQIAAASPAFVLRDFTSQLPTVEVEDLMRRLGMSWQDQLAMIFAHLGYLVPALLFFTAMMHRFRRVEAGGARSMLVVVLLFAAMGCGLVGLGDRDKDDNALFFVLAPAMSVFGSAMIVVLWSRLQNGTGFWARWGAACIALILTSLPMAVNLPVFIKFGLTMRDKIPSHWPPYMPDRAALLHTMLESDEFVFSDAPGFVAWYGDVPCVSLPAKRPDFDTIKTLAADRGARVAGFVMTPVSAECERISDIFTGPYGEWRDLVIRGPMHAFDKDFIPEPDFLYRVPNPLVIVQVGSKESLSMPMVFYSEKERRPKRIEAAPK
jgi:hypothetical protein